MLVACGSSAAETTDAGITPDAPVVDETEEPVKGSFEGRLVQIAPL